MPEGLAKGPWADTLDPDMETIGRYRLTARLGAGSFATVYRGHDEELDIDVAVKVLADNWSTHEDVRTRFLGEARLLRKLNDARIVRVHDIGTTDDGRPYFVMDFANAGSLEDLRRTPTTPGRALRLCAEAARALEVLHRRQIIHRDVTPGNILLDITPDGVTHVKLADLGVAKSMVGQSGATMTAGTPAYMAWEQATGTGTLDQRADVYSMAAVAYALLSGRPPFPVKTLPDLLARNPHIPPPPIADRIGAPRELDDLFNAALSSDPTRRPATAWDLGAAFDAFAAILPGGDTYTPLPMAAPTQLPQYAAAPVAPPPMAPLPGSWNAQHLGTPRSLTPGSLPPGSILATPTSVMSTYLGRHVAPAKPPAKKGAEMWAWFIVGGLAVFAAAVILTIKLIG